MALSVYVRTLLKAAELMGGRKKLAAHLGAPAAELEKWISGDAVPSLPVFLKAVDLILDETPAPGDDVASDSPARDCASPDSAWT